MTASQDELPTAKQLFAWLGSRSHSLPTTRDSLLNAMSKSWKVPDAVLVQLRYVDVAVRLKVVTFDDDGKCFWDLERLREANKGSLDSACNLLEHPWEVRMGKVSGRMYYHNTQTKVYQWTFPQQSTKASAAPAKPAPTAPAKPVPTAPAKPAPTAPAKPAPTTTVKPVASTAKSISTLEDDLANLGLGNLVFIDTLEALGKFYATWNTVCVDYVALDLEGVPSEISLIQVATNNQVFIFDVKTLGVDAVCKQTLCPLLESTNIIKLMHDLHRDAQALHTLAGIALNAVMDTQLIAEHLTGELHMGFNNTIKLFDNSLEHTTKKAVHTKLQGNPQLFSKRPLSNDLLQYAADDVALLSRCVPAIKAYNKTTLSRFLFASKARAESAALYQGARSVWFDKSFKLCSQELLQQDGVVPPRTLKGVNLSCLLDLLPGKFLQGALSDEGNLEKLVDIVLDKGRVPQCYLEGRQRIVLNDNEITNEDIASIVTNLGGDYRFGDDNRAGLEGQLHRISAMRNNQRDIYGLTLRVGRFVRGLADCLSDILLKDYSGEQGPSILFVGIPGSGKTTMIRDVARMVAATGENVCIVDTSNEIGGDSDVPHECIGFARRMMVPTLAHQAGVMIECVQNHTVGTMIIDEIGRKPEVASARTVKQRGVRLIGSVHGDFRTLLKNKDLNGLLGGVETVTLGDAAAKDTHSKSKLQAQRAGDPTFDIVVELGIDPTTKEKLVRIINNTARAVDLVLEGEQIPVQVRKRHESGKLFMELCKI